MDKNSIQEFILRLPFLKESSEAEREKPAHTSGIFKKFKTVEAITSEAGMDASALVIPACAAKIKKKPKTNCFLPLSKFFMNPCLIGNLKLINKL